MFQYISCYSLSAWKAKGLALHTSFNTSHITLYQTSGTGTDRRKQVSIHLMLLFIDGTLIGHHTITLFQYISCYSLSVKAVQTFPVYTRFNTSHVTLYRLMQNSYQATSPFQYISCYSLSLPLTGFRCWLLRFNTSHVTLYRVSESDTFRTLWTFQYISCYSLSKKSCIHICCFMVSIHLMLLFIDIVNVRMDKPKKFQYISCYSLSGICG